jgi:hypothetical protein
MEQAKTAPVASRIPTTIVYVPVKVPVGTVFTILNELPVAIGHVTPLQISKVTGVPAVPALSIT